MLKLEEGTTNNVLVGKAYFTLRQRVLLSLKLLIVIIYDANLAQIKQYGILVMILGFSYVTSYCIFMYNGKSNTTLKVKLNH